MKRESKGAGNFGLCNKVAEELQASELFSFISYAPRDLRQRKCLRLLSIASSSSSSFLPLDATPAAHAHSRTGL